MKTRESGVDLFRCLGMLFVTGLHAFLYNGFYYETQTGIHMWAADTFRWLFFGCNGMFMLLTGYLKSAKPVGKGYYKGLATFLVGYLLTCVISYPIRHFLLGDEAELFVWLERCVTFSNYAWYLEMYIGLLLISPVINLALERLEKPRDLLWLMGTMVVLTALPSLTPLHLLPDYWTGLYPLTYYVIGAVIRKGKPNIPSWLALLGAAATAMIMGGLSLMTAKGGVFADGFAQGGYGGCLTTVMVSLLFLGIYRLRIGPGLGRVLAWMSGGVFEGYILSRLLDVWIYGRVSFWHDPKSYPLIFCFVTIPVFLISITAGNMVHRLAVLLTGGGKKKTASRV